MTWIDAVQSKLPRPDGRNEAQIDDDLDAEFAFHMEMRARQLEAEGMDARAARGSAQAKFGDIQAIKSQCRRLVLQERIMLQRINFVMMIVVLLAVVAVGVQVMITQRYNTLALQAITSDLAKMKFDDAARSQSTSGNGISPGTVVIDGDIQRSGVYQLPAIGRLTLKRLIAAAGGVNGGDDARVTVTQLGEDGKLVTRFSHERALSDPTADLVLLPNDHVQLGRLQLNPATTSPATDDLADQRSKAVGDFIVNLFASVKPDDPNPNATVRNLLDQAETEIAVKYKDDPATQGMIRELIASRRKILQADSVPPSGNPAGVNDDPFPKLSPFREVRWKDWTPFVDVDGTWGELVSINDIPVAEIIEHCKRVHAGKEKKRFSEDLVQVMTEMNKAPGTAVKVQFKDLKTGTVMSIGEAAMTNGNRDRVRDLNNAASPDYPDWTGEPPPPGSGPQSRRDPPATLTSEQVESDILAVESAMRERFSYLHLRGVELDPLVQSLRNQFKDGAKTGDFSLALQRLICHFGDGHGGVDGFKQFVPSMFAPMQMFDTDAGVIATTPDTSEFLDPSHPLLVSINGVPIERLIEVAGVYVADGSPALKRRRSIDNLHCLGLVASQAGVDFSNEISVQLASLDGSSQRAMMLGQPLSKAEYQKRPDRESAMLDDNIGYLRLDQMDEQAASLIKWMMPRFKDTRGLIIDVRGNGGGTRDALLVMLPYLLPPSSPSQVLNVAAYRLSPEFPEDHLAKRSLYRSDDPRWGASEKQAIEQIKADFRPRWQPPTGEFSEWHYLVVSRERALIDNPELFHYDKPVVVLMDSGCFSATDIFLGALKGRPNITLVGTPSSGGSGRVQSVHLPNSGLTFELSSMISFLPDGSMYDLAGIQPDVMKKPIPTDFVINDGTDSQLDGAVEFLRAK